MENEYDKDRFILHESNGRGIIITGSTKSVSIFSVYSNDTLDILHKHALDLLKEAKEIEK